MQAGSIASLAAGAFLFGLTVRVTVPPAAWLGVTLLLHASRSLPASWGLPLFAVVLYLMFAIADHGIIPAAGVVYFATIATITLAVALPYLLDRLVAPRLDGAPALLVFPLALATVELVTSRFSPSGSWGSLAYTQYGWLALMQLAALTGLSGITFLVGWGASTGEWALSRCLQWTVVRSPLLACAAGITLVLVAGALRLALARADVQSLRVAVVARPADALEPGEVTRLVEGRIGGDEESKVRQTLARVYARLLDATTREANAGARLVIWPEMTLLILSEDEPSFLERACALAARQRVYLAMGIACVHLHERWPFENKLVIVDPSGTIVSSYQKVHPVPGWEAEIMRRGERPFPVTATADGRVAGAICFDADFPSFMRQAGDRRADLLLVPANDWRQIRHLHTQMAAFRAIENGTPLVRAAASGISLVTDARGNVLAETDDFSPGHPTLLAHVPIGHVTAPYARLGDWFAWMCAAALAVLIARSFA